MYPRRSVPPSSGRSARLRIAAGAVLVAALAGLTTLLLGAAMLPGDAALALRSEALVAKARSLAAATDAEIARRAELLAALAASPALDQPTSDLAALDRQARVIAGVLGTAVAVADTSLAQLANTGFGFGTPLPGLDDTAVALRALESGSLAVGEGTADAPGRTTAELAVPVRRDGHTIAVVTARIAPEEFARVLREGTEPGQVTALVTAQEQIVAASVPPANGMAPALDLAALASRPDGRGQARSGDGAFLYASSPVAALPAWRVITARPLPPASAWEGSLPLLLLGAGGVAALGGLVAATALRRRPYKALEAALHTAEAARRAARTSEAAALHGLAETKRLHDTIPVGLALVDRELRFISVNAKLASIAGIMATEHMRRRPSEVLPAGLADPLEEALHTVIRTGHPAIELPLSAEAPGAVRNERHFLASCHPVLDGEHRITSVSIVLQDVTERIRAEKARELLVRELNHRVKNTLATVQSIAVVTLRQSGADPKRLSVDLEARLQALARAHDLLTAHAWEATDLSDVVHAALAPWLDSMPTRISIEGQTDVLLSPAQAQAVLLALHELATNAVKHGALSNEDGRVSLRWKTDAERRTRIGWRESDGPPVAEPPREKRGFGTRLLERGLASGLGAGAEVQLRFVPEGLQAWIAFVPARGRLTESRAEPAPVRAAPAGPAPALLAHASQGGSAPA